VNGTGTSGASLWIREQSGIWTNKNCYPYSNGTSKANCLYSSASADTTRCLVPVGDEYQMEPIIMQDISTSELQNVLGELDGVYFVSGFNNGPENVVQMGGTSVVNQTGLTVKQAVDAILAVSGRAFVVLQNVNRTTFSDYVALEMVA